MRRSTRDLPGAFMDWSASGVLMMVGGGIAICIAVFVLAFLYESGRRAYFWSAAKLLGWTDAERFARETARLHREFAADERLAKRDAAAFADTYRRRSGVSLMAVTAFLIAFQHLPWWQAAAAGAAMYAGATMAAGLAWKWW
jgi:hypothetical protein